MPRRGRPPSPNGSSAQVFAVFDFPWLEVSQPGAGPLDSLRTDVSIRDGEYVVVGTSTLKDRGLVLVLSARVVK